METERAAPAGSSPPHASVDLSPTFIVGPARSGTSLLYKLLCLHPDVAWISNWVARFPRRPELAALNRLARRMPGASRRVWFGPDSNAYVYGQARPLLHRIFPMPVEGEPVYVASGASLEADANGGETTLPSAFDRVRRYSGGRRFVTKRIGNNLRIQLLRRTFPHARFVDMVRDGRAVAYSLSRVDWWPTSTVWWYGGTPRAWETGGGDPWELCARNWVEELGRIREGLAGVDDERVFRLRYEQLVEDPFRVLDELRAFIGLPGSGAWTRSLQALSFPDRNDRWKERLSPEAADRITSIQREDLDELGYL